MLGPMPQATVKTYDSISRSGTMVSDDGETIFTIDSEVMDSSPMFRFLRPGQRVTFDLVDRGVDKVIRNLRIGLG